MSCMFDYNQSCAQVQMDLMEENMPHCFENGEPKKFDNENDEEMEIQHECLIHFQEMVTTKCDDMRGGDNEDNNIMTKCSGEQMATLEGTNPECFEDGKPKDFEDMSERDACFNKWTDLVRENCPEDEVPTQDILN